MNAEGAIPVHIDSKRWKAPWLSSSCLPSRGKMERRWPQASLDPKGSGRWVGTVENVNADTGNRLRITEIRTGTPAPHSKPRRQPRGAWREKEEGTETRHFARRLNRFGDCAAPATAPRKRDSGSVNLDLRLGSPTRVLLLGPFARNGCPVFEPVGDTWFASSHVRAQACRRGETRGRESPLRERRSTARGRERALYAVAEVV